MRTWLHRITTNGSPPDAPQAIDGKAPTTCSRNYPGNVEFPPLVAADLDRRLSLSRRTLGKAVLAAVAALPERQRVAFVLHEGGAVGMSEVARRLDTTVPAVRSLLVELAGRSAQRSRPPYRRCLRTNRPVRASVWWIESFHRRTDNLVAPHQDRHDTEHGPH